MLGPAIAIDAEHALERILGRCKADAACAKAFADPFADYHALRERLLRKPEPATVADAKTGRPIHFDFTHRHLSAVLRLASYNDDQAALLPLSLHLAMHENNFMPLANQFRVFARSLSDAFAYGMHNSVACSEDAPLIDVREAGPAGAQCHAHGRRGGAAAHRGLPRMAQGRGGRGPARAVQEQRGGAAAVGRGRSGHSARIRHASRSAPSPTAST